MSRRQYRSKNQIEIMGIILQEAGLGNFLSLKELHSRISYGATYSAVRSSIGFLVRSEMIVKEKSGVFTLMKPTQKGFDWFRPKRS